MRAIVFALCLVSTAAVADWRSVRIARDKAEVAECEFVGNVENRFAGGNRNVANKRMLRQAANRGATHVFLLPESEQGKEWAKALFLGYTAMGEAYRCAS